MPYSVAWDETQPLGSVAASDIDQLFRDGKKDLRERLGGIFGLNAGEFAADPIVPKTLTLSGAFTAASLSGPLTGNVTGNLTGTILTAAQGNITSLGTLTSLTVSGLVTLQANASVAGDLTISGVNTSGLYFGAGGPRIRYQVSVPRIEVTNNAASALFDFAALNISGTILTAAQPNITSLGNLTSLLNVDVNGNAIHSSAPTGTSHIYYQLQNTSGNVVLGLSSSTGGGIIAGLSNYSAVLTSFGAANSLVLGTNGAARMTIDGAGDVVFTGTVTAANFVGPTSIDANNLTGTTLAANVVNSSLTSVGNLTTLSIVQATGTTLILNSTNNAAADYVQALFQRGGTTFWRVGQNIDGSNVDAFQIHREGVGSAISVATNRNVTFSGSIIGNLTGNVTGTILTASQGNITSLGILSSLTVSGVGAVNGQFTVGSAGSADNAQLIWTDINNGFRLKLITSTGQQRLVFIDGGLAERAHFHGTGQFTVGTTSVAGVAAGGIHVAGASVFDSAVRVGGAGQFLFTPDMGTSSGFIYLVNTGGDIVFGLESSTGGSILIGSAAYSVVLKTNNNRNIHLGTNGAIRLTIDGAGAVSIPGATTFSSTVGGITTLTATTINGTLATASQTNITAVGTLGSLAVTGAVTAGGFTGNLTGTVLTAAQGNITSLGTLTSLTVSGNVILTSATSKILMGGTSLLFRNAADSLTYLNIDEANNRIIANQFHGHHYDATNQLLLQNRKTGWGAPSGTAQRGTFATDTVTLINLARAVKALIDDLTSYHGLLGA